MSLVDYASSDDEETELPQNPQEQSKPQQQQQAIRQEIEEERHRSLPSTDLLPPPKDNPPAPTENKSAGSSLGKQRQAFSHQPEPSDLRLPDASLLLNSPSMPSHLLHASDHASRVAVAMAESASRKRDLTGSSSSYPRNKLPKGTLPHIKSGPETAGALLVPPQLTGRSNVVTEDISKLFVKKHVDSSS